MQLEFLKVQSLPPGIETQVCSKCKETLPVTAFAPHGRENYTRTECKKCASKLNKQRVNLKKITPPPLKGHKCPICLKSEEECAGRGGKRSTSWVCDHNHDTGEFRGWICHDCNRGIGQLGDDTERMERAIKYLSK
jgi:hypothetical protein